MPISHRAVTARSADPALSFPGENHMSRRHGLARVATAALFMFLASGTARAAVARFHYVPASNGGAMILQPATAPQAGPLLGLFRASDAPAPRPNQVITFRQPFTGGPVSVPLRLAEGTPNVEYRTNRIVYNYGSYAIEVQFLEDGSVDVIYNSGLFRAL
jgi:hypothetical protein